METSTDTPPMDPDVANEKLEGFAEPQAGEKIEPALAVDPVRTANFILDPSAFTLGLGNIERWFDQEYFQAQVKDKHESIALNLYVPTYTLHELDYQRRGPIVGSTRALEALKFIDRMLETDDGLGDVDGDLEGPTPLKSESLPDRFQHNLFLEYRTPQFPQWGACAKFQIRDPSSLELPSHGKYSLYDEINHVGGDADERLDEGKGVPTRLRHLIRSAVYLTRMKHNGPPDITGSMWKLVTEDAVTRVWASCFGVDCLNINEAELLLFHGKDLAQFEIKTEGADFNSGHDMYQTEAPGTLHKKVNTTSYNYTDYKAFERGNTSKRASGKKSLRKAQKGVPAAAVEEPHVVRSEDGVITEDFNMINFAPREQSSKLVTSKLFAKEHKPTSKPKKKTSHKTSHKTMPEQSILPGTASGAMSSQEASTEKKKPARKKPTKKKTPTDHQQQAGAAAASGADVGSPLTDGEQSKLAKKVKRRLAASKKGTAKEKSPNGDVELEPVVRGASPVDT